MNTLRLTPDQAIEAARLMHEFAVTKGEVEKARQKVMAFARTHGISVPTMLNYAKPERKARMLAAKLRRCGVQP